jgi:hypothetical protein
MTKEEKELLLSVARILRSHMSDHHNADFKYLPDDLKMLRMALKPFESNIVDLTPDGKR